MPSSSRKLRSLDLFSGAGGFALALSAFATPVAYCEIEERAVSVLNRRMRDGQLPSAPVLGDIRRVRAANLPRRIDLITAGFPCPDVSKIGPRHGIAGGDRTGLVKEVFRLARDLKPSYLFLENVPPIARDPQFPDILKTISALGYDWAYDFFSAASEGGAHLRDRWLLLGVRRKPDPVYVHPRCPSHLRHNLRLRGAAACDISSSDKCREGQKYHRLYGNAVVPSVACTAFAQLYGRLFSDDTPGALVGSQGAGRADLDWSRSGAVGLENRVYAFDRRYPEQCAGRGYAVSPRQRDFSRNTQPLVSAAYRRECLPTPRTIMSAGVLTHRTKNDLGPVVLASSLTPAHIRKSPTGRVAVEFSENLMGFPRGWSR